MKFVVTNAKATARKSSLVIGCSAFRSESLDKHESSASHKASMLADCTPEKPGALDQIMLFMSKKMEKQMVTLVNIAYYSVKQDRPMSDFERLAYLHVKNGVKLVNQYLNDKQCRAFIKYTGTVERENQISRINSSPNACTVHLTRFLH